jgi:hypothetical protein
VVFGHVSSDGIKLNVSIAAENLVFLLGKARAESIFPKRSTTTVGSVDVLDIALFESFHQITHTIRWFRCQQ